MFVVPAPGTTFSFTDTVSDSAGTLYAVDADAGCTSTAIAKDAVYSKTTLTNSTSVFIFCYRSTAATGTQFGSPVYFKSSWKPIQLNVVNPISSECPASSNNKDIESCNFLTAKNNRSEISSIVITDTFDYRTYQFRVSRLPVYGSIQNALNQTLALESIFTLPVYYVPLPGYFNALYDYASDDGAWITNNIGEPLDGCIALGTSCPCTDSVNYCPDSLRFDIFPYGQPSLATTEDFQLSFFVHNVTSEAAIVRNKAVVPTKKKILDLIPVPVEIIDPDDNTNILHAIITIPEASGLVFFNGLSYDDYPGPNSVACVGSEGMAEMPQCTSIRVSGYSTPINEVLAKLAVVAIRAGTIPVKVQLLIASSSIPAIDDDAFGDLEFDIKIEATPQNTGTSMELSILAIVGLVAAVLAIIGGMLCVVYRTPQSVK